MAKLLSLLHLFIFFKLLWPERKEEEKHASPPPIHRHTHPLEAEGVGLLLLVTDAPQCQVLTGGPGCFQLSISLNGFGRPLQ